MCKRFHGLDEWQYYGREHARACLYFEWYDEYRLVQRFHLDNCFFSIILRVHVIIKFCVLNIFKSIYEYAKKLHLFFV